MRQAGLCYRGQRSCCDRDQNQSTLCQLVAVPSGNRPCFPQGPQAKHSLATGKSILPPQHSAGNRPTVPPPQHCCCQQAHWPQHFATTTHCWQQAHWPQPSALLLLRTSMPAAHRICTLTLFPFYLSCSMQDLSFDFFYLKHCEQSIILGERCTHCSHRHSNPRAGFAPLSHLRSLANAEHSSWGTDLEAAATLVCTHAEYFQSLPQMASKNMLIII